jgi:D-alanyl-D-alanine carboxypeptidase (penicillin-binding protein 5/6)
MMMAGVSVALWAPAVVAAPPATLAPSTVLIDATSGQVLRDHDADRSLAPGALNQLMLVLLSVEQAALGAVQLEAPVVVSEALLTEPPPVADVPRPVAGKAAAGRKPPPAPSGDPVGLPRRVPLQTGRSYGLGDLLKAVVVSSAPDAAVATANAVGGSVAGCVDLMNARAQKLGMTGTRYASINGEWRGDAGGDDVTTARDLARLAQALVSHREVLDWASLNGLPFDDGSSVLRNVNLLLGTVPGVDGLQVASVRGRAATAPRYHVVATAQRGALRLIAVVVGAASSAHRYSAAAELLEWGFATYERVDIVRAGESLSVPIRIRNGTLSQVTPVAGGSVSLLRRRGEERQVQVRYQLPGVVIAPVTRDQAVGELIVEEDGQLVAVVPVLSPSAVGVSGILATAQ